MTNFQSCRFGVDCSYSNPTTIVTHTPTKNEEEILEMKETLKCCPNYDNEKEIQ